MPDQDGFTDSTDWLPTPLAALAPLDSSLRCQVCKDFFTTPMITSCSHTFCSLCIRRYLSQEGRCPACREADQEIKLRRNWAVEELVANFTASRKGLLAFATATAEKADEENDVESQRPKKKRKVIAEPTSNSIERRSTRSQSKKMTSDAASQQSAPAAQEVIEDSEDEGSLYYEDSQGNEIPHLTKSHVKTEPNDGLVGCPCCHRRMKETMINSHLDKCIQGDSRTPVDEGTSSPAPTNNQQVAPPGTIAYSQRKPSRQNDRLPFINYSLFTDTALRKKLKELGIPNHGSKDLMRRRHTEWVNLWNANCDSTNPITTRELLRELKVWEDTLGRQLEKPSSNTGFMAKDFDRERHIKNQKGNFEDLIKQARERARKAQESEEKTSSAIEPATPEAISETLAEPFSLRPHSEMQVHTSPGKVSLGAGRQQQVGADNNDPGNTMHLEAQKESVNGHSAETAIDISSPQPLPRVPVSQPIVQNGSNAALGTPSKRFFV